MNYPLAVFSPNVGSFTETFIRRYMTELLPGRTAIVAKNILDGPGAVPWSVGGPKLILSNLPPSRLRQVLFGAIMWQVGLEFPDRTETAIRDFLKASGVQVLLGNYLDESVFLLKVAKDLGIRFWGHALGYDISERLRDPKWRTEYVKYNQCNGIVTISENSRQRLIHLGLKPDKIHVIPCSVDVPAEPVRRSPKGIVRCLAVGSMVARKAPILTIDAFRRALALFPQTHLDYVGGGALMPAVRQYVHAFGMEGNVTLHGFQPSERVDQFLSEADIFLQHSIIDPETGDEEGLPVAILRAMAYALPVVSTRHGGIPEAVADGVTGFLVEEGDGLAMADRLVDLAGDPGLRCRMGEAGWCKARADFNWEHERASLLRLLEIG